MLFYIFLGRGGGGGVDLQLSVVICRGVQLNNGIAQSVVRVSPIISNNIKN